MSNSLSMNGDVDLTYAQLMRGDMFTAHETASAPDANGLTSHKYLGFHHLGAGSTASFDERQAQTARNDAEWLRRSELFRANMLGGTRVAGSAPLAPMSGGVMTPIAAPNDHYAD